MNGNSRIATLSPAWGSMGMTISGLAMASLLDPLPNSEVDRWLGLGFLALSVATVTVLTALYLTKMVRYWSHFRADLFNPGQGAQTAAWPASLLISALATAQAGFVGYLPASLALNAALIVGSVGLAGTAVSGWAFFSHVIGHPNVPAQAITAGWFVPVVPLVLVPSITLRLIHLSELPSPGWAVWLAVSAWGVGFGLFMLLAAIIGGRLLMMEPPSPHALPSWWAWLAPLGAGGLGIVTSTRLLGDEALISMAYWLVLAIWGFSAWWVIFALVVMASQRKSAHFHLGYWGFGFPTAAFASLSLEVGRHHEFFWLTNVATVFWVGLLLIVVTLLVRTAQEWRKGTLFPAPAGK
jgi:tellurite resistance protein TehA-like permease